MIRSLARYALVCAAAPLLCASDAADVAAIEAVSAARADAFNRRDAAAIAARFTADAILMPPEKEVMVGPEAVRAYYQSIFDAYRPELESGYEEVRVSGDLAFGRGSATVKLTPLGGGATVVSRAKYINILERQPDGSWKTTHDIWNSSDSPPDE